MPIQKNLLGGREAHHGFQKSDRTGVTKTRIQGSPKRKHSEAAQALRTSEGLYLRINMKYTTFTKTTVQSNQLKPCLD